MSRYHANPMRMNEAAIRGVRPTTRFAAPLGHPRASHLGLKRTTTTRLATSPARHVDTTPLAAIRSAARGHLGLELNRATRGGHHGQRILAFTRSDAVTWSQAPDSTAHRAGAPRSATPWRG